MFSYILFEIKTFFIELLSICLHNDTKYFLLIQIQRVEAKYEIERIGFMPLLQEVEEKYGRIFKTFFCLISSLFEKDAINLNFHD